jgi:GT2 family glycosyltransferase
VATSARPQVRGKFIYIDDVKFYIRGVTYGPFGPGEDGCEYHTLEAVERDFALMATNGVNTVRTYTVPPRWFLDAAQRFGLRVMVGLPWEQHIAFLDDKVRSQAIEEEVRAGVQACAGHPAVLCYAVGNEIPAQIVRWYGRRRIERFLKRLYRAAKAEDTEALVTYANYPTTEYLQLPFIDFVCFNVYLEEREQLQAYLARLQNLADDRPLVMAEVGLDSQANGLEGQAATLDWQVRTAFAAGCAGVCIFAWTDQWHRGGSEIEQWDFGLTDRQRRPKPALAAIREAFADLPFPADLLWPRISVIVCSHNGSQTIRDCCEALLELDYPDYEVIVVDDGSTDATAAIVGEYGFRLIRIENRGLSNARNVGLEAASGEIVAYIDDDAYPGPHWLNYLAAAFMSTNHVGIGGPNIAPPGGGQVADCVANTPGGPTHVLLSDQVAEHIPGCNMAFRREALEAIDGFDPRFRIAGDDVDVCWRLQKRGWTLGFSPAATVWHRRRNSVRAFWKQQLNYGRAEGMLEAKWPEKYNALGHLTWRGRLYGNGSVHASLFRRQRIYHGVWGRGLFQPMYETAPGTFWSFLLVPEWYLIIVGLALLSALGALWEPLLAALPLLAAAIAVPLFQAIWSASQASYPTEPQTRVDRLKLCALTALLHLLQRLARLLGRRGYGLIPWWRRKAPDRRFPWPQTLAVWSETWRAAEEWLLSLETTLRQQGAVVVRGGDYDRWDLGIRGGLLGSVRVRMAIEEHGGGRQLVRFRSWPKCAPLALILALLFVSLAGAASFDGAWLAAGLLGLASIWLTIRILGDCALAKATYLDALEDLAWERCDDAL